MQLIDGFKDAPHITSQQVADAFMGIVGTGDYVFPVGKGFGAGYSNLINELMASQNLMRVPDGVALIQGRRVLIEGGDVEELIIENGAPGAARNDIVVIRYTKDPATLIENAQFVVVKGSPNMGDPIVNSETVIRDGANTHDMPMYRVRLNGISIIGIDKLYTVLTQPSQIGGIITALLADGSVTTSKLADGSVTEAKLSMAYKNSINQLFANVNAAINAARSSAEDGISHVNDQWKNAVNSVGDNIKNINNRLSSIPAISMSAFGDTLVNKRMV